MHGQLEKYLDALQRDGSYRTDAVLKRSAFETTERVYFVGHNGAELGPYVRKRFALSAGVGEAYRRLWEAQESGERFIHLPRILECYDTEDERVVVMEHVSGDTLSDVVYQRDPSTELGLDVFRKLCDAVSELHERFDPPLIHRDLKPSNIMLSSSGLTIIDFGIARSFDPARTEDTRHLGTRNYAPPEQFGFGQTSVRSDIYSMGMVLYYCLTEKTPTASLTESGFDDASIPLALRPVLTKATRFDPQQRYGSVLEMRHDFEQAVAALQARPVVAANLASSAAAAAPGVSAVSAGSASSGAAHCDQNVCPNETVAVFAPGAEGNKRERLRPFARIPFWVGTVWNVLLALVWILFQIADVQIIFDPFGELAVYEPWGKWVMGIGVITIPGALIAYGLADKRLLAKRFPVLARWRWSIQLLVCVVAAVLLAFLAGFISQLALIH